MVEVLGGLVCPVSLVVKTRVDVDNRFVGARGCAVAWSAAVGGEGITESDHLLSLSSVSTLGHCYAGSEGNEAGGNFYF